MSASNDTPSLVRASTLPTPDPATRRLPVKRTSLGRIIALPNTSAGGPAEHTVGAPPPVLHAEPPLDPAFGPSEPWPELKPGTELTVIKRDPAGEIVTTYPAVVLDADVPPGWVLTEARWVNQAVDLDGLIFATGDRLLEAFSPLAPFNAFAVYDPDTNELRGWYANVTYPAHLAVTGKGLALTWRDLYLDVIGHPDGFISLRDEDELAASGLRQSDPHLYQAIVTTADSIVQRLKDRQFPFTP
jgi:hypothetical protein